MSDLDVTVAMLVDGVEDLARKMRELEKRGVAVKNQLGGVADAPGVGDDVTLGFSVGSLWLQVVGLERFLWQCVSSVTGEAVWWIVSKNSGGGWMPLINPAVEGNLVVQTAGGAVVDAGYAAVDTPAEPSGSVVKRTADGGIRLYTEFTGAAVHIYAESGGGILFEKPDGNFFALTTNTNFDFGGPDAPLAREASRSALGFLTNLGSEPDANYDESAGYTVGQLVLVPSVERVFYCVDNSEGAAVWKRFFFSGDVTVTEWIASLEDTLIREGTATTNSFTSSTLSVSRQASTDTREFLMRFELGGIPATATITSATLTLVTKDADSAIDLIGYRLLVGYVASQATWNIRATATNWNTAGALGVGSDHDGTAIFQEAVPTTIDTAFGVDLTAAVQNWVDGTWDNHGFVAWAVDGGSTILRDFHASRTGTAALRPVLEVVYTL